MKKLYQVIGGQFHGDYVTLTAQETASYCKLYKCSLEPLLILVEGE